MRLKYVHIILCMSIYFFSCVKDRPNPDTKNIPENTANGLLVLNEGSYGNNNAELSYIDFENLQVSNTIFKTVNSKSLGDVAQSITLINGLYYITVNNSHKIEIIDTSDFFLVHTIENIRFPRYITQVSHDIAYVSSLYMPHVYVLQLSTNSITDTLYTDFPNTEKMLVVNNDVWICNWDTACNYLYQTDKITHQLKEKIMISGYAPHDILQDKNGMLWVLSGNKYKNKTSWLTCINPLTNIVEKTIPFSTDEDPVRLTMNATKDTIYYINVNYNGNATNNGLYRMSIHNTSLPLAPFIQAPVNTYFWAIGIDSVTSHIFLSDPKGFTQSSTIYEYSANGSLLHSFQAGVGSNQFLFRQ